MSTPRGTSVPPKIDITKTSGVSDEWSLEEDEIIDEYSPRPGSSSTSSLPTTSPRKASPRHSSSIPSGGTTSPPVLSGSPPGKQNFLHRAKRNIAGKAATSGVGRTIFNRFADEETVNLLAIFRDLVGRHSDPQTAKNLQENVMRILVKVLILYEDKFLTEENFQEIYGIFRKLCALIKNTFWNLKANNINPGDIDTPTTARLCSRLQDMHSCLASLLSSKLQSHTLTRLHEIFNYIASEDFIKFVFADNDFEKIVMILAYYLNHY